MQLLNKKRRRVTINITSLIDVVLLLLIFFMVSTNFIEQPGMKLDLPDSETASSSAAGNELEVIVQSDGSLFLNGEAIKIEELRIQFEKFATESSPQSLFLKADKNVTHGIVMEVMDIARLTGIQKIIIASTKKAE